jgi:hypothetical protein
MPITELAFLPVKDDALPLTSPQLHPHFVTLAAQQSAHSRYKLHFFQSISDPSLIILLSGWESVEAHNEWIAGEKNQALLKAFAPVMDMTRLYMVHLGIEPANEWKNIEVLAIERGEGIVEGESASGVIWEAVGDDVEAKTKDRFRLKGYSTDNAGLKVDGEIVAKRVNFQA